MRRRGSSLIAVLFVLALLALAIGTAGRVLSAHVSETRARQASQYAGELARSGIAWSEAHLASGGGAVRRVLPLSGGEVAVTIAPSGDGFRVVSAGRVLAGKRVVRERTETADITLSAARGR